jgi:hypothetical protein
MALKQDFQQQLQNQLAVWQEQIKGYQERVAQAQASARADYGKAVATLRQNAEQASKLLSQVQPIYNRSDFQKGHSPRSGFFSWFVVGPP